MKVFIVLSVCLAVASAATFGRQPQYKPQAYKPQPAGGHGAEIPILRSESNIDPSGQYSYNYETGNGISAQESGVGGQSAQGSFQWSAPDGTPVQIQYIADENGYQPSGDAIPTPPPIPELIARALEYIRSHPAYDDSQHRSSAPSYRAPPKKNIYG